MSLTVAEQRELLILEELLAQRKAHRKFFTYFPESGPLRRDLYAKHLEFFAAGAMKRERCFLAANRVGKCITYQTVIETPDGERTVGELYERGEPFRVWAWDGVKRVVAKALPPFQKQGWHACYRVLMSDGRWFECADDHRILTASGWQLFSRLLESGAIPLASTAEHAQRVHNGDGQHWFGTPQDSQGDYLLDCHCDDGQPQWEEDSGLMSFPLQGGAQPQAFAAYSRDALAYKHTNISLPFSAHLSILYAGGRNVGQYVACVCQTDSTSVAQWLDSRQGLLQLLPEFSALPQLDVLDGHSVDDIEQQACFSPFYLDSNRIISCISIGINKVYDFTVPLLHNYITAGIVHHNTEGGLYEDVCHLTGRYPEWWQGKRFAHPVRWWIAGDTSKTVKDILQEKLLGPVGRFGTGMLPGEDIIRTIPRTGVPEAVEAVRVHHYTNGRRDGESVVTLKSYEQGRESFQGTEQDGIHLDEESPLGVYSESLIRTMTTNGLVFLTFTPLQGLSETVLQFLPDGQLPTGPQDGSKYVVNAGWDDVPHLHPATKEELKKAIPPYQIEARTRGLPMLGAGVIYPLLEDDYLVDPFDLPKHWRRAYAMDVGWNRTAALWGAYDPDNDIWYAYNEHYRGEAEPSVHAAAIKGRGDWIPGVIDPAARGRGQKDGYQLLHGYVNDYGLILTTANNAVEAGIYQVWERLSSGRLKVFRSLSNLRKELRLYRRDEKGRIVKVDDHLADCLRYLVASGAEVSLPVPVPRSPGDDDDDEDRLYMRHRASSAWMG